MNHSDIESRLRFYKRDRTPRFLGNFNSLLLAQLRKGENFNNLNYGGILSEDTQLMKEEKKEEKISNLDYVNILNEGRQIGREEGREEGLDVGIRSFIASGKNQLFVTKEGQIYPFGNMNEIFTDEKTVPPIKNFLEVYNETKLIPQIGAEYIDEYDKIMKYNNDATKSLNTKREKLVGLQEDLSLILLKPKASQSELYEATRKINFLQSQIDIITNNLTKRATMDISAIVDEDIATLGKRIMRKQNDLGYTRTRTVEDVQRLNDVHIIELNAKPWDKEYKTPKSTSKSSKKKVSIHEKLKNENSLKKKIDNYFMLQEFKKLGNKLDNIQYKVESLPEAAPDRLAEMFREKTLKTGNTVILKTDEFDIYNVPNIRKLLNPSKEIREIRDINEEIYTNLKLENINDRRTNPIKYKTTLDYLNIPKSKINLFEHKVNERFQGNIPNEVVEFMKGLPK